MLIFGTNRRLKVKSLSLKEYFLHYLLTFVLPIPLVLMIIILAYAGKVHKDISDSVFKGIKERTTFVIEEQINSQRQRVLLYRKDIQNFAEVVSSYFLREVEKGKGYQEIDLSPLKIGSTPPSLKISFRM